MSRSPDPLGVKSPSGYSGPQWTRPDEQQQPQDPRKYTEPPSIESRAFGPRTSCRVLNASVVFFSFAPLLINVLTDMRRV